jgi:hypothetical protein
LHPYVIRCRALCGTGWQNASSAGQQRHCGYNADSLTTSERKIDVWRITVKPLCGHQEGAQVTISSAAG